jgi:hypothetical protein
MIRPVSKPRSVCLLNDYQVLKGNCERTMQPFGAAVSAAHEARLLIEDDRRKLAIGLSALYVIYQRSENRILQIFDNRRQVVAITPRAKRQQARFPLAQAA